MKRKYTSEEVYNFFIENDLKPLEPYINCKQNIKCETVDGYFVNINLDNLLHGRKGKIFSTNNKYVMDNVKHFISVKDNGEYTYVSGEFKNANSYFTLKHNVCGKIFTTKQCNLHRKPTTKEPNRHGTCCPQCNSQKLESTHATVLKQVFMKEMEGTVLEDCSCINPNTNKVMPIDIVNHNNKLAIEIQSWYHDFETQKVKDEIKKNYQLSKGYDFYALDQRDYTVLEMIQIFFPTITEIPNYIDTTFSYKLDDIKAQKILNKTSSVVKTAKLIGCDAHLIYDAIRYKRITYPKNYKKQSFSPVVQLDKDMNFVAYYDSIKEAIEKTGSKYIASALFNNRHYSGGYLQYYAKDYYK